MFNQIWQTIESKRIPLVVHNGFLDLMHVNTQLCRFITDLLMISLPTKQPIEPIFTNSFPSSTTPSTFATVTLLFSTNLIKIQAQEIATKHLGNCNCKLIQNLSKKINSHTRRPTRNRQLRPQKLANHAHSISLMKRSIMKQDLMHS